MAAPSSSPSAEAEYWRIRAMAQQVRAEAFDPRGSGSFIYGWGSFPNVLQHQTAFHALRNIYLLALTFGQCQSLPEIDSIVVPSHLLLVASFSTLIK